MTGKNLVCFEIFELNHGRILSKIRAEGIYVEKAVSKGRSLLVYCRKNSCQILLLYLTECVIIINRWSMKAPSADF